MHRITVLLALCLGLGSSAPLMAARDLDTAPALVSDVEVVVVEAQGCSYCALFRRDVAPLYRATPRAARVPMRFADVIDVEGSALALSAPIDTVPTVLVLRANSEIGRLTGYTGPADFLRALSLLLAGVE